VRPSHGYFINASRVHLANDAKIIITLCRNKWPEDHILLGSGHVASAIASARPPDAPAGRSGVTFLTPPGFSADDVVVTDDKNGIPHSSDVKAVPCPTDLELPP
jgi:hypothetical protein